jgi:hypothetical protein
VTELPSAPATERNRTPILTELTSVFAQSNRVLEIGSGTGQHGVYFAPKLPHLVWQTSEMSVNMPVLKQWLAAHPSANLPPPMELDVDADWPDLVVDGAFSANTAHIMSWRQVCATFHGVAARLLGGGCYVLYGPFAFGGSLAPSNARFDGSLKCQKPSMGIRDLEELEPLAKLVGLQLRRVIAMPANNHLLVWHKP